MKSYSQFIDEALLPSLIKAAARQFVKSKALQKAVPKSTTIPVRNVWDNKIVGKLTVASNAPDKVKLKSAITGFRSGGGGRGSNFDPMKGSKYQFDPVKQTSISNTASGHHTTPAGIKPKSSHTRFGTPSEIAIAKQKGDLRPLEKTPKIGLSPYEKWKTGDYPAGVEYAKGKFSEPNWSPSHMGSPIVDIQTQTGSKSNLPLFGAERKEIKDRVKTELQTPANIRVLKKELGIKPMDSSNSSTTYRNLGAGRKESVKEQKTFSQFIIEAEKQLKLVRLRHGTSSEASKKIKKSGFKGDEVHTSTNTDTARGFGRRYDDNPSIITMLVPKNNIKDQPEKDAKAVKTQGQRGTDAMGRRHYSVALDPEYASTKIVKQSGTVQKPKVAKRFR